MSYEWNVVWLDEDTRESHEGVFVSSAKDLGNAVRAEHPSALITKAFRVVDGNSEPQMHLTNECGCCVLGTGTIPDPFRVEFCRLHRPAPRVRSGMGEMLEFLKAIAPDLNRHDRSAAGEIIARYEAALNAREPQPQEGDSSGVDSPSDPRPSPQATEACQVGQGVSLRFTITQKEYGDMRTVLYWARAAWPANIVGPIDNGLRVLSRILNEARPE